MPEQIERWGEKFIFPSALASELNSPMLVVEGRNSVLRQNHLTEKSSLLSLRLGGAESDWAADREGRFLAVVLYSSRLCRWRLVRLYSLDVAPDTAVPLSEADVAALAWRLSRELTQLDDGDCEMMWANLLDVGESVLDTSQNVGCVPKVIDVERLYLLLQTPAGTYIVVDTPLGADAAAHYTALGWRVLQAAVQRDYHGLFSLAFLTGFGFEPDPEQRPAVEEALAQYLALHSWEKDPANEMYAERQEAASALGDVIDAWRCPHCGGELGHPLRDGGAFPAHAQLGGGDSVGTGVCLEGEDKFIICGEWVRCLHCQQKSIAVLAKFLEGYGWQKGDNAEECLLHFAELFPTGGRGVMQTEVVRGVTWWLHRTHLRGLGWVRTYLSACLPVDDCASDHLSKGYAWANEQALYLWPEL